MLPVISKTVNNANKPISVQSASITSSPPVMELLANVRAMTILSMNLTAICAVEQHTVPSAMPPINA